MNNIPELIADGEITPIEAAQQLALVTSMLRQLKDSESVLRGYLTDHLDPKEHLTTALGVVSYKRGGEAKWRVKDPVAFGQWLARNGEESSVEEVLYPVEFITKPDAIEKLVRDHGGEQPDGVELSGGRADSVATSKVKAWSEVMADLTAQRQAGALLGIEQPPVGDIVEADGMGDMPVVEDNEGEDFSWDKI
ncbi:hypothetical protein [Bifidobacterium crudilactis]|uniref:hypothetical protein n=1 Tax=Bifidobacterium crudilactis TaxID=327277 RepID=UPI002649EEFA|nr:hypothetical protein [Bifidobacterium crudilactis]MDN6210152.1 hypothetical protein [Bifidobacterium crudilactis]